MTFTDSRRKPRTSFCGTRHGGCRVGRVRIQRGVTRALEFLRRSWLAVALFAFAGILFLSAAKGERGLERVLQLQREVEESNDRNFHLVQQISELRREQTLLESDDATLERTARQHLSMVRPGEVLYHVPPPQPADTTGGEAPVGADGAPAR